MAKEAADGLRDERPFAGVHILATALMCSAGATADELELARRILERDPRHVEPRENESIAGTFNRHMDAAIDSVNDSVGEPTRAGRRARLAADLERAGLILADRAAIAEFIAVIDELRREREDLLRQVAELDGEDLGAELAADALAEEIELQRSVDQEQVDAYARDPLGLEFLEGTERGELNPSVND